MSDNNGMISDEAVEAALAASRAYKSQRSMDNAEKQMRAILEAAAPSMLAGAWDAGADAGLSWDENRETEFTTRNPYRSQA